MTRPINRHPKSRSRPIPAVLLFIGSLVLVDLAAFAQDPGLVARWTFDEAAGPTVLDNAGGLKDAIEGHFKYAPGVTGSGLKFDGYTTRVIRKGSQAPRLGDSFTMEAWIAMAALPWNWCPILSQERDGRVGYSFGIGPRGEFGLKVSVRGEWRECLSQVRIPLKKWTHVAAVFDAASGIKLFLDGQGAGALSFQGKAAYAGGADLLIGMNPEKRKPSHIVGAGAGTIEGWYAFDGIMDEIRIYNRPLGNETIPLCQPGQSPEDILNPDAVTILNLKGESRTYSWPGEMNDPGLWKKLQPENPNIQVVNLKSKAKPFIIFEPGCRMHVYVGRLRKDVSDFSAYNHFPVSLIPSDGRFAVAPDRITSFSISYTDPPRHVDPSSTTWASWIYGVAEASFGGLAALGRSWANAPGLAVQGPAVVSEGYDLSQRAYVLHCRESGKPAAVDVELRASAESPAANVALLVKGWGEGGAALRIDGKAAARGRDFRIGSVRTLEATDLVVWIKLEAARPVKIVLAPD